MATTATTTVDESGLVLTPPDPVPPVAPEKAAGLVPLEEKQKTELEKRVDQFVDELIAQDVNSPEFGKRVDSITALGQREIRAAAGESNRFLDRPIRAMDQETGVGTDLAELRRTIEDLDPSSRGDLFTKRKLVGIIPFGSKLRNYFDSYQSAQGHIAAILGKLAKGKDELLMDNAAISVERQKLWAAMGRLEQMIHMSKALDQKLGDKALELDHSDPAKAKAIRETALF